MRSVDVFVKIMDTPLFKECCALYEKEFGRKPNIVEAITFYGVVASAAAIILSKFESGGKK